MFVLQNFHLTRKHEFLYTKISVVKVLKGKVSLNDRQSNLRRNFYSAFDENISKKTFFRIFTKVGFSKVKFER